MSHLRKWAAALFGCLLLAGCRSALIAPAPVTIQVVGSTSFTATLHDLAAAYQARHPNVSVAIEGTGSTDGLRALAAGEADLAAVSWQFPKASIPDGLEAVPVARDAVAVIVNPANTIKGFTLLQIKALYQGETLDWSALSGPAGEPVLVSREDGSGTRAAFESLVMASERVTLNAIVMPSSQSMVDYVATHPMAIGYVTMAEVSNRVRAVKVEDAAPVAASVQTGAYHLTRLISLYRRPGAAQGFVDFVLSPAGQAIVAQRQVPIR
ncbi:MAG TPA: phosphate ABC transporter substrate-binding protein [Anaerolineae bacterium]